MDQNASKIHPLIKAFQEQGIAPKTIADLAALPNGELATLVHLIDESSYSLNEWAESFVAFQKWCVIEQRSLDTKHMLEYISCCAESGRSGVKLPLPFLLQEFLRTNGVE